MRYLGNALLCNAKLRKFMSRIGIRVDRAGSIDRARYLQANLTDVRNRANIFRPRICINTRNDRAGECA